MNERRTVVLNLPLDVQSAPAPAPRPRRPAAVAPAQPVRPSAASVRRSRISSTPPSARSSWPAAAAGARRDELLALAAHAGALVATSAVANGLFNDEAFTSVSPADSPPRSPRT